MNGPDPHPWFAGDLDDPWVAAIADALPRGASRIPCAGNLPDIWPARLAPRTLVVHRPTLTLADAARLASLRARGPSPPRVVLCLGAYARQHQWEPWAPLVDVTLPEATAPETVSRHLAGAEGRPRPAGPRPDVAVVGGDSALRSTIAEACAAAGYPAVPSRGWVDAAPGLPAVWIAPVLEDDWARSLSRAARSRPVVALMGFADRATVALARSHGASACLDLPCDPADLAFVLDRLLTADARPEAAHQVPPAPAWARHSRAGVADPGRPA